jgi:beta-1,4-mannosyl-glycoprotein beta-1,4-N-acetylglucosaminyltransferase
MIIDCITFFRENFITNIRFEILNSVVDYFIVCESKYDHRGNKKKLNFKLKNKNFKKKIIYLVLGNAFPENYNSWERQAHQREYIITSLKNFNKNDYIMFSDPDEIPNPKMLKDFILEKKYGIFLQKHFVYKFNIFNHYSTPWEGTRICKLKDLQSIDFMRQKVLLKNLHKWWRPDKERNIQIIKDKLDN